MGWRGKEDLPNMGFRFQKRYHCKMPLCAARRAQWARGGFAAFFACLKPHFPALKIFYDLRLDLRFVCYNSCELNDMDMH